VKPGINGIGPGERAQFFDVGRENFELDVYYVDHYSVKLDLRILWMTFASVIKRQGISQAGHATARRSWDQIEKPQSEKSSSSGAAAGTREWFLTRSGR